MSNKLKYLLALFIIGTTIISAFFFISLFKVQIRQSYIDFFKNYSAQNSNELNHYLDKQKIIINSHLYKLQLEKRNLNEYIKFNHYQTSRLPAGYLENIGNKFILVSGHGKIVLFDKNLSLSNKINSNLSKIIEKQRPPKGWYSIRDVELDNNNLDSNIYVSYYKRCDETKWKMSILKASLKDFKENILQFKDIDPFDDTHCISDPRPTHSGGRIEIFDEENLLVSVGDFMFHLAQDKNSIYGKTLLVNKQGKEYKIFSSGHRNVQGLHVVNKELIFSSEHGNVGGDEINRITFGNNYGWPNISYSTFPDDVRMEITVKRFNSHKNHFELGYTDPLFAMTPAIGPSEIYFYNKDNFKYWKNKLVLSSLKAQSLYILSLDENFEKITHMEKIYIGSRIRDFLFKDNSIYLVLEGRYNNEKDNPNLGKITIE